MALRHPERVGYFHTARSPNSGPFLGPFLEPFWGALRTTLSSENTRKIKGFGAFRVLFWPPFWAPFGAQFGPHFGLISGSILEPERTGGNSVSPEIIPSCSVQDGVSSVSDGILSVR